MLDAAFRQIAAAVSSAVGGPFHAAKLLYSGTPVYDGGGDIIVPATPYEVACTAQIDAVTEAMRQAEGFLERDVRILILGPDSLTTEPDLTVSSGPFSGQAYSLITVQRDPLAFGWECRARAI